MSNVPTMVGKFSEMAYLQEILEIWYLKTRKVVTKQIRHCQSIKHLEPCPKLTSTNSEGALIRWAWNGTTKLPVSAYPLYDRPLGVDFN
jgi:hypothetical protein